MALILRFIQPCALIIYRIVNLLWNTAVNAYYLISWLLSSSDREKEHQVSENAEMEHPVKAVGWAARDTSGILSPFKFSRRATREHDVQFKIFYCGICHSDLHQLKNDLGISSYPLVPGHEIVGVVTQVGSKVRKVKVGDKVGVGCMVGSCRKCDQCVNNLENYCPKPVYTYSSIDSDGTMTYGGYSNIMVADEHFIIRWPENLPLDSGAPLLCAGSTTYSALKYYGLDKPGLHIGVVGLGGLGHVAIKFAKAFGAQVTVISSSASKRKDAIETMGADAFILSRDSEEIKAAASTMDGIIDTVSADHPAEPLISLLKPHGKLVLVGVQTKLELPVFPLVSGGKMIGGSFIAGLKETQEMIDFAAEHNVAPMVEIIPIDYVNKAMERLEKGDVKYRFVIDVGNTLKDE
ncbi:Alcohol dehydrogenase, class V [Handroanthus impetiginosus]|uniref:Alcohol dehydrogenase, class V n=1 Tax=Handroanthus impetiginosus TaxID=429701 RepID=A0A2G9G486_9LAMI|nr:Alcohol dehydrogenase, class V [Handroanthus impetiginosus]